MEDSQPDPTLDFVTSFAKRRQRMLGSAARVLTTAPESWTPAAGELEPEAHPLPSILLASLEELKVAEEEMLRQHETLQATRDSLAAERDRFRSLFEQAPVALLLTDRTGSIRDSNRAAAAIFGRDIYHLERKPLTAMIPAEERASFRQQLARLVQTGGASDWHFRVARHRDTPVAVTASVNVVADRRFGSALYWRLDPDRSASG